MRLKEMNDDKLKWYIQDLGVLLKEKAREAKISKDNSSKIGDASYEIGYLMAFYEVIDVMKQQAKAFNIEQEDIGLADIDVESELL